LILIVDRALKKAKTLSEIFYYMGVISTPTTPDRALKLVTNRHRAIIISNPEELLCPEELIRNLKTLSLGSPVFALCSDRRDFIAKHKRLSEMFNEVYNDKTFSSTFMRSIVKYQRANRLPAAGDYKLAGLDASVFRNGIYYFDLPIPFTKTESMIIRYLIRMYPTPARLTDIMKNAFKSSKRTELSNIRTHISFINKKHREYVGRPLIFSELRVGYRILTPEMAEYKKEMEEKMAQKREMAKSH